MPPTFSGDLLQDPVDFAAIATERDLVRASVDYDEPAIPLDVDTFAELQAADATVHAAAIAVMNRVILETETQVNGYARSYGYQIPLVDAVTLAPEGVARSLAARLAWIYLLVRRKVISADQFESDLDRIQRELIAIANGRNRLNAVRVTDTASPNTTVYDVKSEERVFSRTTWESV